MEKNRFSTLIETPEHLITEDKNAVLFTYPESNTDLYFLPVMNGNKLSRLEFKFDEKLPMRGLIEAVCCIYENRFWYELFQVNQREILSFISLAEEDVSSLESDLRDLCELLSSLGTYIGKTLLTPFADAFTGQFFQDLADLEQSWSQNINSLFKNSEIKVSLDTFHPPIIGVTFRSQTGLEGELLNFLNENLPIMIGHTQWKLVALTYQNK
ncbi:MAG: hypothetical protein KC493_14030 [Bacteriovoracaceae bacterium]|nr:hypothetical protein [Bacteriovoracaceae bacterium]